MVRPITILAFISIFVAILRKSETIMTILSKRNLAWLFTLSLLVLQIPFAALQAADTTSNESINPKQNLKMVFAGTFDPPTNGHLDIILRASNLCDKLYVCIAVNPTKTNYLISPASRLQLLQELTKVKNNIEIVAFDGLLVNFAKEKGVDYFVRGLRSINDFESEYAMNIANRQMSGLDTVFLLSSPECRHISSTIVREIAKFGGDVNSFVPPLVAEYLSKQ